MNEAISKEKVVQYIKVDREHYYTGQIGDDYLYDMLTVQLHGFIAVAAKEKGEITVFIERPTFWDWLFRRTKVKKVHYAIRQLMKTDLIDGALPIIETRQTE